MVLLYFSLNCVPDYIEYIITLFYYNLGLHLWSENTHSNYFNIIHRTIIIFLHPVAET